MKLSSLRPFIPLAVFIIISVGFILNGGVGTLSAVGWGDIALLCPLGALTTMIASKTILPKAIVSLVIVIVLIVIFGRAFCAWACPVPMVSKLRHIVKPRAAREAAAEAEHAAVCADCASRGTFDSRHVILAGSLLSAAVLGFPVFCLICPIGLTFATILLVILLFSGGDITWSIVVVPFFLAIEVVFFRKWCTKICPISAFMSLVGKANKTFQPSIDDEKCLEAKGGNCGRCAAACPQGIDPRHPEKGAPMSECTRCLACLEACPSKALTLPLLPKKGCASCAACASIELPAEPEAEAEEAKAE